MWTFGRKQGSKPLNRAFGPVQSFEINDQSFPQLRGGMSFPIFDFFEKSADRKILNFSSSVFNLQTEKKCHFVSSGHSE